MQLEKCVELHPYAMILREKDMDRQDYREFARHIQVMCKKASVKMFVHSDISAAKYADCGNVHFSMEHFKQMCEEQADVAFGSGSQKLHGAKSPLKIQISLLYLFKRPVARLILKFGYPEALHIYRGKP